MKIPKGAFYVFPNIQGLGRGALEFSERLLEEAHVGVCPGEYFGKCGEGYIRLCYAVSLDKIKTGMDSMEKFIRRLRTEKRG